MHRRSTRRQASSINRGEQQKRVVGDTTQVAGRQLKEKQRPLAECVRAERRRQKAQQRSAPDACIAMLCNCERTVCNKNVRHPRACTHQAARSARPPRRLRKLREGGSIPEGQRNSREAENTDYAKEHRGAKHKDSCLSRDVKREWVG